MYQLTDDSDAVLYLGDHVLWIPVAPGNRHYEAYLAWLADGNEPLSADNTGQ